MCAKEFLHQTTGINGKIDINGNLHFLIIVTFYLFFPFQFNFPFKKKNKTKQTNQKLQHFFKVPKQSQSLTVKEWRTQITNLQLQVHHLIN